MTKVTCIVFGGLSVVLPSSVESQFKSAAFFSSLVGSLLALSSVVVVRLVTSVVRRLCPP